MGLNKACRGVWHEEAKWFLFEAGPVLQPAFFSEKRVDLLHRQFRSFTPPAPQRARDERNRRQPGQPK